MTTKRINTLLRRRNKLLTRRDMLIDWDVIRHIDAQLAEVAPGVDNRVDLALGRRCAVLPERTAYNVNATELTAQDIIDMEERTAETSRGEDYDSLTETY